MPESSLLEFDTGISRTGDTRRSNLLIVLACIESHGTIAQREISTITGIPPAAVSTLVAQLLERGLVTEQTAAPTGNRGRPRRLLTVSATAGTALGIDINAEGIAVRAVDPGGRVIATAQRLHRSIDVPPTQFSAIVFDLVSETVSTNALDAPISAVIAVPGLSSEGLTTSRSRGWITRSVDELFTEAPRSLALKRVVNDGDAAVTAEYTRGSVSPSRNVTVLHGSDGLAGGVVCEGRLLLGYAGAASSLGHVLIDPDGDLCDCGNRGCLVTIASISALARVLGRTAELDSTSTAEFAARLRTDAVAGDAQVLTVLSRARDGIRRMSRIIGAIVSPEVIVLTGNLMPVSPWLTVPHTRDHLQERTSINWESPVISSTFASDSVVVGAAELARRALLLQPEVIDRRSVAHLRRKREAERNPPSTWDRTMTARAISPPGPRPAGW